MCYTKGNDWVVSQWTEKGGESLFEFKRASYKKIQMIIFIGKRIVDRA